MLIDEHDILMDEYVIVNPDNRSLFYETDILIYSYTKPHTHKQPKYTNIYRNAQRFSLSEELIKVINIAKLINQVRFDEDGLVAFLINCVEYESRDSIEYIVSRLRNITGEM